MNPLFDFKFYSYVPGKILAFFLLLFLSALGPSDLKAQDSFAEKAKKSNYDRKDYPEVAIVLDHAVDINDFKIDPTKMFYSPGNTKFLNNVEKKFKFIKKIVTDGGESYVVKSNSIEQFWMGRGPTIPQQYFLLRGDGSMAALYQCNIHFCQTLEDEILSAKDNEFEKSDSHYVPNEKIKINELTTTWKSHSPHLNPNLTLTEDSIANENCEKKKKNSLFSNLLQILKIKDKNKMKNPPPVPVLQQASLQEGHSCQICFENEPNCLLVPCHHLGTCEKCTTDLIQNGNHCPFCRVPIKEYIKVFRQ